MKYLLVLFITAFIALGCSGNKPEMVFVEGGTFTMGLPKGEYDRFEDATQHQVTVSSFYMSKYEVTQKEWTDLMGSNPSNFIGDNRPVDQVTWLDAVNYCNIRSSREGVEPVYTISGESVKADFSKNGYRLPTEAEWEYAARGGKEGSKIYMMYSGSNNPDEVAWYNKDKRSRADGSRPVGGKKANYLGLHDMTGNVYEWCWDWRIEGWYDKTPIDPTGASEADMMNEIRKLFGNKKIESDSTKWYRVIRGGSFADVDYGDANAGVAEIRSGHRYASDPAGQRANIGFRVVRSAR